MTPTALASVWPPNRLVASRAGHKAISPVEAIRQKCLDCSGHQPSEVKLCEAVTCPLWPFRAGRHPYTRKSLQDADSEQRASEGTLMPLTCPSSKNSLQEEISRKAGTSSLMRAPSRPRLRSPEMARPSHKPDPELRRQVEALAGFGIPEADIAGLIGIDPKTLRKYYRQELDHGHTKANARVAENLFRKATGDGRESVTAAIFWLKARARWKETTLNEHTGIGGKPIEQVSEIRRIIISPLERAPRPLDSPALPSPEDGESAVIWEAPSR